MQYTSAFTVGDFVFWVLLNLFGWIVWGVAASK